MARQSNLKVVIAPRYREIAAEIEGIPDHRYERERVFCNNRNVVETATFGGHRVVVKQFRVPNAINRFAYRWLRHSKARRSFDNASMLLEHGIATPEPIAWIEERRAGLLHRSWYVSAYEPLTTIGDIVKWEEIGRLASLMHSDPVFNDFRRFAVEMFRKEIFQKDFNRANFLIRKESDGRHTFSLVDINRVRRERVTPLMMAGAWRRFGAWGQMRMRLVYEVARQLGYSDRTIRRQLRRHFRRETLRLALKQLKREMCS